MEKNSPREIIFKKCMGYALHFLKDDAIYKQSITEGKLIPFTPLIDDDRFKSVLTKIPAKKVVWNGMCLSPMKFFYNTFSLIYTLKGVDILRYVNLFFVVMRKRIIQRNLNNVEKIVDLADKFPFLCLTTILSLNDLEEDIFFICRGKEIGKINYYLKGFFTQILTFELIEYFRYVYTSDESDKFRESIYDDLYPLFLKICEELKEKLNRSWRSLFNSESKGELSRSREGEPSSSSERELSSSERNKKKFALSNKKREMF